MTTQAPYKFTIKLRPWGNHENTGEVGIDPEACYGYWERRDGSEGGGLWFEKTDKGLTLIDYDGCFNLPPDVIRALKQAGIQPYDDLEIAGY